MNPAGSYPCDGRTRGAPRVDWAASHERAQGKPLVLLAERVVAGLRRGLPRRCRAALLLLIPLGFRLLLFLVAFHLTFRHGVRPCVGLAAEELSIARFRCTLAGRG